MGASDYLIDFIEQGDLLRVAVSGTYSLQRSMRLVTSVAREARSRGLRRVLMDVRGVPEPIPDGERFAIGEFTASALRGLAVAFIDPTESPDQFVETVAVNRGALLRGFLDEATALDWLNGIFRAP